MGLRLGEGKEGRRVGVQMGGRRRGGVGVEEEGQVGAGVEGADRGGGGVGVGAWMGRAVGADGG